MTCTHTYYPNGLKVGACFEVEEGAIITGLSKKQNFSGNGTIDDDTDLAVNDATGTIVMPIDPQKLELVIKSLSGTTTLDPGVNTVENGNSVTATVSRRFNLDGSVWIEIG